MIEIFKRKKNALANITIMILDTLEDKCIKISATKHKWLIPQRKLSSKYHFEIQWKLNQRG